MMKKLFSLFAMGALLIAASCSNDDALSVANNGSEDSSVVTFTVQQAGSVQTRASVYGSGTKATQLYYYVYQVTTTTDDDGNETESLTYISGLSRPDGKADAFDEDLTAEVSLTLINGNTYSILFLAASDDAVGDNGVYTVAYEDDDDDDDEFAPTLTIDIDNLESCEEAYDLFYNFYELGQITANREGETIKLTRPFAQINFGTSDLEAVEDAGVDVDNIKTTLKVSGAYDVLDFSTGAVSRSTTLQSSDYNGAYTYDEAALPDDYTFPVTYTVTTTSTDEDGNETTTSTVTEYDYVSMNYVLYDAESGTVDLELTVVDSHGVMEDNVVVVSSVPVQRNYQTNIYGSLLTSTVDYTIEIVPAFTSPSNEIDLDQVDVSTADELVAALAQGVGEIDLTDNVEITDQLTITESTSLIDLGGNTLSISSSSTSTNTMLISEEGTTLTIQNGTISGSTSNILAIATSNTTVIIDNVTIAGTGYSVVIGDNDFTDGNNTVIITNSKISSENNCGVIFQGAPGTLTIDNCTIESGYFGVYQQGSVGGTTFNITNSKITAKYSGIFMSNGTSGDDNTLNVNNCVITSNEESAIEVKRTNITVSNAKLVTLCEDSSKTYQKYGGASSGSNGYGYGIMLASYASGVAFSGDVSLTNIYYYINAESNATISSDVWNVCLYNGSGTEQYTNDGSVESDPTTGFDDDEESEE